MLHQSGLAEDDENVSSALSTLEDVQRALVELAEHADLAHPPLPELHALSSPLDGLTTSA